MQNEKEKFKNEFKSKLYNWVLKIIKILDKLSKDSITEVMGKQLLRSSTSVLANYIEAKSASSKKDFINFFTHSLKSANESGVWLTLLKDTDKLTNKDFEYLNKERQEVANIIASSIITMKRKG
jgi:four helix bundle protein